MTLVRQLRSRLLQDVLLVYLLGIFIAGEIADMATTIIALSPSSGYSEANSWAAHLLQNYPVALYGGKLLIVLLVAIATIGLSRKPARILGFTLAAIGIYVPLSNILTMLHLPVWHLFGFLNF